MQHVHSHYLHINHACWHNLPNVESVQEMIKFERKNINLYPMNRNKETEFSFLLLAFGFVYSACYENISLSLSLSLSLYLSVFLFLLSLSLPTYLSIYISLSCNCYLGRFKKMPQYRLAPFILMKRFKWFVILFGNRNTCYKLIYLIYN